jgi:protein-tyrosine phosphatase
MDDNNMRNMKPFIPKTTAIAKMSKITDYCTLENIGHVPDPYYGGSAGFEHVLDILEDACNGLLSHIIK